MRREWKWKVFMHETMWILCMGASKKTAQKEIIYGLECYYLNYTCRLKNEIRLVSTAME